MSRYARVTSIETVQRFRNGLCEFGQSARDTLCAVDMHIRRTLDWLAQQGKYWQREIKVRQEEVVRTKIELTSRKFANRDGRGPGTTDQEKAFRRAQARLKDAEDKAANCRRWLPLLQHAIREFQGPARQLSTTLDSELQHSVAILDQKLTALAAYLALVPPDTSHLAGGDSAIDVTQPVTQPTVVEEQSVVAADEPGQEEPHQGSSP